MSQLGFSAFSGRHKTAHPHNPTTAKKPACQSTAADSNNSLWRKLATTTPIKVSSPNSQSSLPIQRMCQQCEEENSVSVQAKLTDGPVNDPRQRAADGSAEQLVGSSEALLSLDSGPRGGPINDEVKRRVEPHLGADLSEVQVHQDEQAKSSAAAIHARAFTHGSHIYLGAGESDRDIKLMAHELTHTVQQRGPGSANISNKSATPSVQAIFDKGCYRSSFSGVYETKRDFIFNRIGWKLIHPGACECEGQMVTDCCEPGDRYCADYNIGGSDSCRGKSRSNCSGPCTHPRSGNPGRCAWGGLTHGCRCQESYRY